MKLKKPGYKILLCLVFLNSYKIKEQLKIDRKQVQGFYDKIIKVDENFAKKHSFEKFLEYFYLLCSRFFGIYEYDPDTPYLVPYADLLNTNGFQGNNAAWDYDPLTKMFRVIATSDIKAGEPLLFCYGHNSNFTYFSFYGITFEPSEYNSIALVIDYNNEKYIPNGKIKAEILGDTLTMTKKIRFYADFDTRVKQNMNFMQKCRFLWSNGSLSKLCKVFFCFEKNSM